MTRCENGIYAIQVPKGCTNIYFHSLEGNSTDPLTLPTDGRYLYSHRTGQWAYACSVMGHNFVNGKCACGIVTGDVSGDGKVNIVDVSKVFAHVRKKSILTDAAALAVADVNGDEKINLGDVARIFAHVRGKNPLF